jgi:hypothetical protein
MEASVAPGFTTKSSQPDLLQMHPTPSWKRYESEEEDVSETGSQSVFSPTDGEASSQDDESTSETEAEMLSPSRLVSPDDSSSLYSNRLSIITAKRSSAATYVAHHQGQDTTDDDDVSPYAEYVSPPVSPFYLLPVCYVPEASGDRPREEPVLANENDEEGTQDFEFDEVFEAKQVVFTAPASRPSIIMIPSPTTEAILSARMGDPTNKPDWKNNSVERPVNITKRSSTKRSSSASGMSPVDRPKRYSAMFYRDLSQHGEVSYFDSRNHVRAQSSQCHGRGRSRPRADSSFKERSTSRNTDSPEPRPFRSRRNTSQQSSTSNQYTPDNEKTRNYSRPGNIRSSSVASDTSSVSWKRVHSHNWSNTSLQHSRSSSVEPPQLSSSSTSQNEGDIPKLAPHPLSIITTPTSLTTSPDPEYTRLTPQPHSALSSYSEVNWSPVERTNTLSTNPQTFPYSRPRNPSLTLSLATAPEDLEPARAHSRMRKNSSASSPMTTRKLSLSTSGLAPASSKAQTATSSPMKLLMGGFRGLGKQRAR